MLVAIAGDLRILAGQAQMIKAPPGRDRASVGDGLTGRRAKYAHRQVAVWRRCNVDRIIAVPNR